MDYMTHVRLLVRRPLFCAVSRPEADGKSEGDQIIRGDLANAFGQGRRQPAGANGVGDLEPPT